MSRVGRKVIAIPQGVKVQVSPKALEVQGPKGKLETPVPPGISFSLEGAELTCKRTNDERQQRAFHGMARALAQNAVKGVTEGFSKELDIVGVGYKAAVEGAEGRVRPRLLAPRGVQDPRGDQDRGGQADAHRGLGHRPAEGGPGRGGDPAACASPIRTSRRGSATWARS